MEREKYLYLEAVTVMKNTSSLSMIAPWVASLFNTHSDGEMGSHPITKKAPWNT